MRGVAAGVRVSGLSWDGERRGCGRVEEEERADGEEGAGDEGHCWCMSGILKVMLVVLHDLSVLLNLRRQ